jgi:hypothetical protein
MPATRPTPPVAAPRRARTGGQRGAGRRRRRPTPPACGPGTAAPRAPTGRTGTPAHRDHTRRNGPGEARQGPSRRAPHGPLVPRRTRPVERPLPRFTGDTDPLRERPPRAGAAQGGPLVEEVVTSPAPTWAAMGGVAAGGGAAAAQAVPVVPGVPVRALPGTVAAVHSPAAATARRGEGGGVARRRRGHDALPTLGVGDHPAGRHTGR